MWGVQIRARLPCAVRREYLHVVRKDLSISQFLKQGFISSPFRDFHFQELHQRWVFRSSSLLDTLHVFKQLHHFGVDHLRAESPSQIRVLDVHVGVLQTQMSLDIVQGEKESRL